MTLNFTNYIIFFIHKRILQREKIIIPSKYFHPISKLAKAIKIIRKGLKNIINIHIWCIIALVNTNIHQVTFSIRPTMSPDG